MIETRKQMYKILDKYMDKTLSEGCLIVCPVLQKPKSWKKHSLISIEKLDRFMIIRNKYIDITYIWGTHSNFEIWTNNETWGFWSSDLWTKDIVQNPQEREKIFRDNVEIIGHYEIWAVIRCIDDLWEIEYDSGNKFAIYNYTASNYLWIIENKPLQLWTTEEEQNFINITKELWTKKD